MKTLLFLLISVCPLVAGTPLFDGKSLRGWEIRKGEERWWTVRDGAITGGSLTEKVPHNTFLSSEKAYGDFELTFKVKLTKGAGFINSGIQVRSTRVPDNSEMSGYQVDAGIGWWGKLYDESRRNRVIGEPVNPDKLKQAVHDWDWNEYRILCEGRRIRTWINGVVALDYTEPEAQIPQHGHIGLQAHGGGTFLVQFKDILIRETAPKPGFKGAPAPKTQPIQDAAPKSPEEQLQSFHLPDGFEIELVAAEDPAAGIGKFVSVYFDQRGRMWTQTALEYPVDGNENAAAADALFASKAKDKILVYGREAVFGQSLPAGGLKPDQVFADGLAIPLGILPWGDGSQCYALHGRDIVLLTDTDGDQKADRREVVLTGFGIQDSHLFPHQFTRAPGGWIWMAQGAFNYSKVRRPAEAPEKAVRFDQTRMARFRPDGSGFEITSNGPCNIWGLVIDRNGQAFIQEANDFGYGVMPFHEHANYPGCSNSQWKSYAPAFPPPFPAQRFGGTGLSGLCLTDGGGAFPPPYGGLMLVANPITNRINTVAMTPLDELSPVSNLSDWSFEKLDDFLTCDDPWFRPVAMTLGPDGCVYVVDWYNKIISHNEVPRAHPERDKTRGRIWRIKHRNQKPFDVPDFTKLKDADLHGLLDSPSLAQVHLAWQALADRGQAPAGIRTIPELWAWENAVIRRSESPSTDAIRIPAGLLGSKEADVRREAVRVLGNTALYQNRTFRAGDALPLLAKSRRDADKNVRRQAIQSIGLVLGIDVEPGPALRILLEEDLSALDAPTAPDTRGGKPAKVREAYDREYERYLTRMILETHPEALFTFLQEDATHSLPAESRLLAALALPANTGAAILAANLSGLSRAPNPEEVLRLVQGLELPEVQAALKTALADPVSGPSIIDALLVHKSRISAERVGDLVHQAASGLFRGGKDDIRRAIALSSAFPGVPTGPALHQLVLEADDVSLRVAALNAIALRRDGDPASLGTLADEAKPELQAAALSALAESRLPAAPQAVIARLPSLPPHRKRQAIESLSSHPHGASALLDACLAGKFAAAEIEGGAIERLQKVLPDDDRVARMLASMGDIYRPVLALDGHEAAHLPTGIHLTGPFTVEAWVKLEPGIDNRDSIGGSPDQLDLNFAGSRFRVYEGPAIGDVVIARRPVAAGLWTHVCATREADGLYRIYINGEADGEGRSPQVQAIGEFRIGWSTPKGGTDGRFAEFRIWNRARTPDEIRANFDRSFSGIKDPALLLNATSDHEWRGANAHAAARRTTDLPPVMTLEQAARFDQRYQHLMDLARAGGDVEKGRILSAVCTACHLIGDSGNEMGPNLSGVGAMGPAAIIRNILTPNAAIEPGYRIFRVEMSDGALIDGFLAGEDASAVVIRRPGGAEERIERSKIRQTSFLRQSLMPEGLIDGFADEQVRDLLAYLQSLK